MACMQVFSKRRLIYTDSVLVATFILIQRSLNISAQVSRVTKNIDNQINVLNVQDYMYVFRCTELLTN